MNRDTLVQFVAGLILIASLTGAGLLTRTISQQRQQLNLVLPLEGTQGMPPHVALATAALGTFRGLAIDVLWIRADDLEKQGQYFEAQTLSQWITRLQPRFPKVWWFQAHNLSYNLAVSTMVPQERWNWVVRGAELLRDQGIPQNPNAGQLYEQLGWIYHHKIGGKLDREHWYYKTRLARDMQEILGDLTAGRTTRQVLERFSIIANASETLEQLLAAKPAAKQLVDIIRSHNAEPDEAFLRMMGTVLMYDASMDRAILLGKGFPEGTNVELVKHLRSDPALAKVLVEDLIPHLQKRVLKDRLKMDPVIMLRTMEAYGPLDWRHPHSIGVYWSERGIEVSRNNKRRDQINELMIMRGRLHMIVELLKTGRVEYSPTSDKVDQLPDPRYIAVYQRTLEQSLALINSNAGVYALDGGRATEGDLLDGYENFLNLATLVAYLYGDPAEAATCFIKMREIAKRTRRGDDPLYQDTVEYFVSKRLAEVMDIDVSNTRQFIDAMIRRAMLEGLAQGKVATFNRFLSLAKYAYDRRFGTKENQKHVKKESELAPFPQLVQQSFNSLMKDPRTPALERARIWNWAPDELRDPVWDGLKETLEKHALEAGLKFERAFPAPASASKAKADDAESKDVAAPAKAK